MSMTYLEARALQFMCILNLYFLVTQYCTWWFLRNRTFGWKQGPSFTLTFQLYFCLHSSWRPFSSECPNLCVLLSSFSLYSSSYSMLYIYINTEEGKSVKQPRAEELHCLRSYRHHASLRWSWTHKCLTAQSCWILASGWSEGLDLFVLCGLFGERFHDKVLVDKVSADLISPSAECVMPLIYHIEAE